MLKAHTCAGSVWSMVVLALVRSTRAQDGYSMLQKEDAWLDFLIQNEAQLLGSVAGRKETWQLLGVCMWQLEGPWVFARVSSSPTSIPVPKGICTI